MYEFSCDQCRNTAVSYVEPARTATGKPEVWCFNGRAHKRNEPRRMVEGRRVSEVRIRAGRYAS